jgi:ubiquinone/menaquinone biosynthesis C-methylase UbiE
MTNDAVIQNENEAYRKLIKASLKNNKTEFCPFRKEKQMDYLFALLENDCKVKNLNILEAGCGYGRLLYFLNQFDNNQNYFGFDYVSELIEEGQKWFIDDKNVTFKYQDLMMLPEAYDKFFDITISYKTFSWLPYYDTQLRQLFKVTKNKIYITSLFAEEDIDYIVKIFPEAQNNSGDVFSFLNTYSLPKFKQFCSNLGAKNINVVPMALDFDLPKPENFNKLATYTVLTSDQRRLEITNNTILNWKLVEIDL